MIAFHGDAELKQKHVDRLKEQRRLKRYDHSIGPTEIGVPEELHYLRTAIFEGLPREEANAWAVEFLEAIKPGSDLTGVRQKFESELMRFCLQFAPEEEFVKQKKITEKVLYLFVHGIRSRTPTAEGAPVVHGLYIVSLGASVAATCGALWAVITAWDSSLAFVFTTLASLAAAGALLVSVWVSRTSWASLASGLFGLAPFPLVAAGRLSFAVLALAVSIVASGVAFLVSKAAAWRFMRDTLLKLLTAAPSPGVLLSDDDEGMEDFDAEDREAELKFREGLES